MMTTWEKLIERYANGQTICNCRQAYRKNCGHAWVPDENGHYREVFDYPACEHGCDANKFTARDYIVDCLTKELEMKV